MTTTSESQLDPRAEIRSIWVLWICLILGVVVFGALASVFVALRGPFLVDGEAALVGEQDGRRGGEVDAEGGEDIGGVVGTILGVLALAAVGVSFLVPSLSRREPDPVRVKDDADVQARDEELLARLGSFRRRSLRGWALAEGAANLAVVTVFMVGFGPLTISALLLYAVQMLMTAPTRPRIREAVGDHFSLA